MQCNVINGCYQNLSYNIAKVSEVKRVEVLFESAGWSLVQINGNQNIASAELKNFW